MGFFNFISEFSGFSGNAVAIDLGTCNTLIAVHGAGVVLNEATAVAVSSGDDNVVLAVGNEAIEMSGRTPSGIMLKFPFRDGVIADFMLAQYMIHDFFRQALKKAGHIYTSPRVLLCLPQCVTDVERRAVCEAVRHAGAREVLTAEEVMAACVGSSLPYREPVGSMVVDIGGGTTDAAVIALDGIVVSKSIRLGGTAIDKAIINAIRKTHNTIIGSRTAERVKKNLGTAKAHEVSGINLETGLPHKLTVDNDEIAECITPITDEICELCREVLSVTPPELSGDIYKSGITLCGGGSQLFRLPEKIESATGIDMHISPAPLECVATGALEMLNNMRRGKAAVGSELVQETEY